MTFKDQFASSGASLAYQHVQRETLAMWSILRYNQQCWPTNGTPYLNDERRFSSSNALLQKTRPIHETVFRICHGEEREICLGSGETLASKANPDVHPSRGYCGFREIGGHTGEACLADERSLHVHEKLALGKTYL